MNNERIDVLAVIRRMASQATACRGAGAGAGTQQKEDEHAIAAVAELIEAAKLASGTLGHAYHTVLTGSLAEDAHTAYQRLDAAIAMAGGDE